MKQIRISIAFLLVPALFVWGGRVIPHVAAADGAPPSAHSSRGPPDANHGGVDTRTPLPLTAMMAEHQKANMRDHLAAVEEIVAGLAAEDLAAVAKAARRIGTSDTMARMCHHMGAGAPGFTEMGLAFHRTADTIAEAADRGDPKAATSALGATLGTCVGCHATYRQEVVDEAAWQRLATEPATVR